MTSTFSLINRNRTAINPPSPAKDPDAIKIGLFGASWIAPQAVILPTKSHPEVIVHAIAARDLKRAEAYAKKHGIPHAYGSYQALLDNPSITAVYIPLPNSHHYEWTLRALRAGKHVLVEKPFVSNAAEARSLISTYTALPSPAPILLEAVHYLFHPAWQTFLSLLSAADIVSATTTLSAPAYVFAKDNIRFVHALGGGAMMDVGLYGVSTLREVFGGRMPEECVEASPRLVPKGGDQACDQAMKAAWRWPGGAVGRVDVDLARKNWLGMPVVEVSSVVVKHREVRVPPGTGVGKSLLEAGLIHVCARTVTFWNFVMPTVWHRIDIVEEHTLTDPSKSDKVVAKWTFKKSLKAYTWGGHDLPRAEGDLVKAAADGEGGAEAQAEVRTAAEGQGEEGKGKVRIGEEYWTSYRYMLEEFVNRIKGRSGSGVWVTEQESIDGMTMIDQAYEKCGMPLRPTSTYQ